MEPSDSGESRRLPTGAHGIPPDVVARNQHERLVAALAEACAEHGYAETSVADLAHRAGVSTATFYKLFADKRTCAMAAHQELLDRLLDEVDRACAGGDGEEGKVRVGVRTVLELFAADPPSARLLTVEVLALGPAGAARNDAAIEAFASRLQAERSSGAPSGRSVDVASQPHAAWALVASISMLVGKHVMAGDAAALPALEDELVALALRAG